MYLITSWWYLPGLGMVFCILSRLGSICLGLACYSISRLGSICRGLAFYFVYICLGLASYSIFYHALAVSKRTEPFDFLLHYSDCAVCRYSGATWGSFIQQGCLASATRAGAGAGPRPVQAHISCLGGHQRPKTGALALAGMVLISQRRNPEPAAWAGLAPATSRSCLQPARSGPLLSFV